MNSGPNVLTLLAPLPRLGRRGFAADREQSYRRFRKMYSVAVVDDGVVGYAHAGPHPPRRVHQLYRLYVDPEHWRQGIARNLLAEIEQSLYDRDAGVYEAEVLAENDRAVAFYESTGFEQVEERETDHKGVTTTEYIFRKRL